MWPLHLSKCKFTLLVHRAVFFSIIDPINDLSSVDDHGDVVFFFDKLLNKYNILNLAWELPKSDLSQTTSNGAKIRIPIRNIIKDIIRFIKETCRKFAK